MTKKGRNCLIIGMSGAGKSTALRVFEDLGYLAIAGLPLEITSDLGPILRKGMPDGNPGVAIVPDMRQKDLVSGFARLLEELGDCAVIFLDADNQTLIRRYASTRRPHPLESREHSLDQAIQEERALMAPLKERADLVLDSSDFSIHDLRRTILANFAPHGADRLMRVQIISFGYKYGIPADVDFVFDLRFLANPYFDPALAPLSGRDAAVRDYVLGQPAATKYLQKMRDILLFALPQMEEEGRYRVSIGLGCTGGRHRSVVFAEVLGELLEKASYPIAIDHRCIGRHLG